MNKRIDGHLQQGIPLAVEPKDEQVQQAREKNPVFVVRRKPCAPGQMAFQPGLEQKIHLIPLVPVGHGRSIHLNDPQFGSQNHQKQRGQPRR